LALKRKVYSVQYKKLVMDYAGACGSDANLTGSLKLQKLLFIANGKTAPKKAYLV